MVQTAWACFTHHVPIVHLYAGIGNNLATFDDIGRHCITLMSDVQLCESIAAESRVRRLCDAIGKPYDTRVVGITHLDDMKISTVAVPQGDYDLVLYNPPTLAGDIADDLRCISRLIDGDVVVIEPNADAGRETIIDWACNYGFRPANYPRPQFLGLLKHCRRFITNSSVEYYEAPHFLNPEQIIHVGHRNKNRDRGPFETGASDRVIKILEEKYG
jgi:UDP-N-acetylglucosamine 2-epimerase